MSLYIRNPEVDALAEELRRITNARTKTEAVREALEARLAQVRRKTPSEIKDGLAHIQARARAMGPTNQDVDMKAFMDEMWGD